MNGRTMTDREWYQILQERYAAQAAALEAEGWTCVNRGERFVEHFERDGVKVHLVRELGKATWQVKPFTWEVA